MDDFERGAGNPDQPKYTAEEELKAMLGPEGHANFNKHFPPDQVLSEVKKAEEREAWLKEKELAAETKQLVSEIGERLKTQVEYLNKAINYFEVCHKSGGIPANAQFIGIFSHIEAKALKLLGRQKGIESPYRFGTLSALMALIDLKRDNFPDNSTLPDIIEALNDKYENLKQTVAEYGTKPDSKNKGSPPQESGS